MARTSIPLTFGGGLDRASGVLAVDAASFRELYNVHLGRGRVRPRRGYVPRVVIPGVDAVLELKPIRAQGLGAALTFIAATGAVDLYRVTPDGLQADLVGNVWTLGAGAGFPSVSADDSYGRLFIAHDEPDYAARGVTRVYDPASGTIADLTANLNTATAGPGPVKFRGVARHLAYIIGWGHGTEDDGDRPEIVRVSLPADPLTFNPEHYFIAGQRGEPVLSCISTPDANGLLKVLKESQAFDIFGTDRPIFGIRLADPSFGVAGARLAVIVGGSVHHWSLHGPRVSQGGASQDASPTLDLQSYGYDAPSVAAATADPRTAFAYFDPVEREVVYQFGTFAYVLSLSDPSAPRWLYRTTAAPVLAVGTIYPGLSTLGPTSHPEFTATPVPPDGDLDVHFTWSNVGVVQPGTTYELWRRDVTGAGAWALRATGAIAGASQSSLDTPPIFDNEYEYAMRFKAGGFYANAYLSANPADWPSYSRFDQTTGAAPPASQVPQITDLALVKAGAGCHFTWTLPSSPSGITWVLEASSDGGATFYAADERVDTGELDYFAPHDEHHWRLVGQKAGYADSLPSNVVTG